MAAVLLSNVTAVSVASLAPCLPSPSRSFLRRSSRLKVAKHLDTRKVRERWSLKAVALAAEDVESSEAAININEPVSKSLESITDSVGPLDTAVQDSITTLPPDGTAGETVPDLQESLNKLIDIPETTGATSTAGTDTVVNAVEDTLSKQETLSDAVQGITDGIDSSTAADNVVKSATENGSTSERVLTAQEKYLQSIGGGLKQTNETDVFDGLKDVQDSVTQSVDNLVRSVTGAFEGASNAVKSTYEAANETLVKLVKSVTGSPDNDVSRIPPDLGGVRAPKVSVDVDFTAPFRMGTPANDALKEVVIVLKDVSGKALVTAGDLISNFYATAKDSLPEDALVILNDIEDKVSQVSKPLGGALNQAYAIVVEAEKAAGINPENPVVPVILVVGGTLFISISWFRSKYGGYAGDLQPSEALELLKKEGNVVLVDVRPQELREREGVPDLRRSTRYKFAAVEILKTDKSVRGQLKKASEVDNLLTAAVIRNLKNVDRGTKIIVLDEDGNQSKEIARGLRKAGTKRAYRVEGGYKAWAKQGLRSKADSPQTPLTILKEDAEAIVEEVNPTVDGVILVSAGLVAATYALFEWEKTLQLVGFVGLAATAYFRLESYESVEDFKADLRLLQKPFTSLIQSILLLTGQAEKGELQLATSPASSAVQGRILQAAAKHGAASEKDQGEVRSGNITEVSEEEMASAVDDSELNPGYLPEVEIASSVDESDLNQSHSPSGIQQQEPPLL